MIKKAITYSVVGGTCIVLGVGYVLDRAITRAVEGCWKPTR